MTLARFFVKLLKILAQCYYYIRYFTKKQLNLLLQIKIQTLSYYERLENTSYDCQFPYDMNIQCAFF